MDKKIIFVFWITFLTIFIINLRLLPIFEDEGEYLLFSEVLLQDPIKNLFIYPENGLLPTYGWIVSIINSFVQDSLTAGRLANILLASSLIWWFYQIQKLYNISSRFTVIGILLTMTSPIILLNSRVALLDMPVMVFTAWYLFFTLKVLTKPTKLSMIGLGISLTAAVLTKATALFGLPAVCFILIHSFYTKNTSLRHLLTIGYIYFIAFILSGLLYVVFNDQISADSGSSIALDPFKNNLWLTIHWSKVYYLPYILILPGYLLYLKKINNLELHIAMIIWIITSLGIMIVLNQFYYPRHILLVSLPLILITSLLLNVIPRTFAIILFIFIMIFGINLSKDIVLNPAGAQMALEDKFSYYEDYTSGFQLSNIAYELTELSIKEPINVYMDGTYVMEYGLRHYLIDSKNINLRSFRLEHNYTLGEIKNVERISNTKTYVLVNKFYPKNTEKLVLYKEFPVSFRHSQKLYFLSD